MASPRWSSPRERSQSVGWESARRRGGLKMKASRFTAEQIVAILHEAAAGAPVARALPEARDQRDHVLSLGPAAGTSPRAAPGLVTGPQ